MIIGFKIMKKYIFAIASAMVLFSALPAFAADDEIGLLKTQIKQMQKQITSMQSRLEKQEAKQAVAEATAKVSAKASNAGASNISGAKISFKPSPKIESLDGKFSFQPFGRIHLDNVVVDDGIADHADNSNFRRARIGFKGKFADDFLYKVEFDFAKEAVAFKDVSLTYTGFEFADIKAGNFKPALGLEEHTSSNYIQFMERSAPSNAFARDEEIGLAMLAGDEDWSFAIGAFRGDAGDTSTADDEGYSVDARATFAPIAEAGRVIHTGLAVSHRGGSDTAKFSAKPTGIDTNSVATGTITTVDSVSVVGVELATVFDSFSAQGEYFSANVRRDGASNPSFDGWVVQMAYLLTGESRPYSSDIGNFKRVKPKTPFSLSGGGIGAWELLARFENLDLSDAGAGITGGELNNTTLGLNWYINNNTRLMFNYINVDTDSNAVVANDNPQIFAFRAAWDF